MKATSELVDRADAPLPLVGAGVDVWLVAAGAVTVAAAPRLLETDRGAAV